MSLLNLKIEVNNVKSFFIPKSEVEVIEAIKYAQTVNRSVHVVSAGFNWGYGTNKSIDSSAIVVNLSQMNKILSFDEEFGIIKIQPGVTQGQLEEYLRENNLDYYVPTTGAGHRASILGNALERGFGLSPLHDHAASITSIKGIMHDGSIYQSGLNEISPRLANTFHWGVGIQLDKLVSQSSWLIVTEASIKLKKRSKYNDLTLYMFNDEQFPDIINGLRNLNSNDHSFVGSIKIFNQRQVFDKENKKNDLIPKKEWLLAISVHSSSQTRSAFNNEVGYYFKNIPNVKKLKVNEFKLKILNSILKLIPLKKVDELRAKLNELKELIRLTNGKVSEVGYSALDPEFNKNKLKEYNFDKFNKELVWCSPITPLNAVDAKILLTTVKEEIAKSEFSFNTYTWTVINSDTMALVMPILFEKEQEEKFWEWYKHLHRVLKSKGFIPYRFHIKMMPFLREELMPEYFKHAEKVELALDPEKRILKGRY